MPTLFPMFLAKTLHTPVKSNPNQTPTNKELYTFFYYFFCSFALWHSIKTGKRTHIKYINYANKITEMRFSFTLFSKKITIKRKKLKSTITAQK